jgi:hypothetical protein
MAEKSTEIETNIFHKNTTVVDNSYWINRVTDLHKNNKYVPHVHSIPLGDDFYDLKQSLFKVLYEECTNIFGDIEPINSVTCSAYISNKNWYRNGIHHHTAMSIINSVYYLNVPSKTSGGISFFRDPIGEVPSDQIVEGYHKYFTYQPDNNDLLIFPNYLLHNPEFNNSEEFRISINMEIYCADVWTRRRMQKARSKYTQNRE